MIEYNKGRVELVPDNCGVKCRYWRAAGHFRNIQSTQGKDQKQTKRAVVVVAIIVSLN